MNPGSRPYQGRALPLSQSGTSYAVRYHVYAFLNHSTSVVLLNWASCLYFPEDIINKKSSSSPCSIVCINLKM